jgi:hypothetical protein
VLLDFFGVLVFLLFAVVSAWFLDDLKLLFGFGVFVDFPLFEEVEVFELPVVFGTRMEGGVALMGLFFKEEFFLNLIRLLNFNVFVGKFGLVGGGNGGSGVERLLEGFWVCDFGVVVDKAVADLRIGVNLIVEVVSYVRGVIDIFRRILKRLPHLVTPLHFSSLFPPLYTPDLLLYLLIVLPLVHFQVTLQVFRHAVFTQFITH